MRRSVIALILICCTATLAAVMTGKSSVPPTQARIVCVQRGDVHQVAAITGYLSYAEESYAYAKTSGVVSRVCVEKGQRVSPGEALVRMDDSVFEDIMAAAAYAERLNDDSDAVMEHLTVSDTVIRAQENGTVRQILVTENMPIAMGTPVVRLSSGQQEIVCKAAAADSEKIEPGMWAWIASEGKPCGLAVVREIGEMETDNQTGLAYATVVLQPQAHIDVREGAAVDAEVYLAGSDDVQSLPLEAITERNTVWWVCDERCTEIPAEIVMADEMRAWVNLPEGMPVAIGEYVEGQRIVEEKE